MRHASVPFNQSAYWRTKDSKDEPKTFFKGAVTFLGASSNSAFGDGDESVKNILEDQVVQRNYNESVRKSKEEDLLNSGLAELRGKKVVRKQINIRRYQ